MDVINKQTLEKEIRRNMATKYSGSNFKTCLLLWVMSIGLYDFSINSHKTGFNRRDENQLSKRTHFASSSFKVIVNALSK